jgi:hypothetical protein
MSSIVKAILLILLIVFPIFIIGCAYSSVMSYNSKKITL